MIKTKRFGIILLIILICFLFSVESLTLPSKLIIKDASGKRLDGKMAINSNQKTAELFLNNTPIKKIKFKEIKFKEIIDLGIDDTPETGDNSRWIEIYAIDPTQLEFDNATITAIAKGTELWKCRDWNFIQQECYGTWIKLTDIIPGEEYTFILTPDDPALGESGLFFEGFESGNLLTNNWTNSGSGVPWRIDTVPYEGLYNIRAKGASGSSIIETNIDTTGYENIWFSFYVFTAALDPDEYITADWFNGTAWINLLQIENVASYTIYSYNLSQSANNNPNFKVRFRCEASSSNEKCQIDNVQVAGDVIDTKPREPSIIMTWIESESDLEINRQQNQVNPTSTKTTPITFVKNIIGNIYSVVFG